MIWLQWDGDFKVPVTGGAAGQRRVLVRQDHVAVVTFRPVGGPIVAVTPGQIPTAPPAIRCSQKNRSVQAERFSSRLSGFPPERFSSERFSSRWLQGPVCGAVLCDLRLNFQSVTQLPPASDGPAA